ncbi:MAG: GTPase ObgE [Proteobacteria bacterium]|nr:GTPase ObgE [Pseudomonadota bacterium]
MAFIDEAKFFVKAGDGGNGCVSFRREKFVPKGGPNGGDGGKGGSVIIRAVKGMHSLIDFQYRSHFKAERGEHGQGKDMHGRGGKDCIVDVPVGSVIRSVDTDQVLADLTSDGATFIAAAGGEGGMGNPHFASGTNRTPRIATNGKAGEEFWLKMELKLIADVGLVGLPNAGKSTLLSKLSAAHPKIASYPFTTLEPQLGVMQYKYHEPCIIADIPGLVAGAHEGIGLGHKFLRHIERTSVILHVLDAADENVKENYKIISNELALYKEELAHRTQILVLNKKDLLDESDIETLIIYFRLYCQNVMSISGEMGDGIDYLKETIALTLEQGKI